MKLFSFSLIFAARASRLAKKTLVWIRVRDKVKVRVY
jgi:hypothetical protein